MRTRSKSNPLWLLVGSIVVSEGNIMEPHRGGTTGRKMKKVSPEDLFGWLDEERFIDVKQPKKRRSTSAPPPPPTGRKTHVKTKNSKKSSELVADNELKRASKRSNDSLHDTISRGPSAAVTNHQSKTRRGRCMREKRQQQQQRKSSSFTGTTFCISDLPSESLIHVASFLAKPSQALFAAALQGLDKKPGEGIISGNQWDVLEFGEIEKALAVKLTDDHISAVLLCIGPSKVKKLRLTNLVNITGVGLEPLRGSLTVEQIDFSIVGEYKSPVIDADGNRINKELPLSCDNVLPILYSIIEREGCALKHLQFPKVWREKWFKDTSVYSHYIPGDLTGKSDFYRFHRFLHRYNNMLRCRGRRPCDKCNEDHRYCNGLPLIATSRGLHHKYIQQHTCYECLKQCCTNCARKCGGICERYYCSDCRYDTCENCGTEGICKGCKVFIDRPTFKYCENLECDGCSRKFCTGCQYFANCIICEKVICGESASNIKSTYARLGFCTSDNQCEYCNRSWCKRCQDVEEFWLYFGEIDGVCACGDCSNHGNALR